MTTFPLRTLILAGSFVAQGVLAQWPQKPIRVIVPYTAGGTTDIMAETAGINIVHIPYKGGSEVMRGLVSGDISMAIISNGSATTALASGKVRLVAVLDNDRDPKWPTVASVTETYPEFERTADWTGIFGPAGMARPLVQRLNAEIVAAFNAADSVERLANVGLIPQSASPEEFSAMVLRAVEVNRKGVRLAGIKQE